MTVERKRVTIPPDATPSEMDQAYIAIFEQAVTFGSVEIERNGLIMTIDWTPS